MMIDFVVFLSWNFAIEGLRWRFANYKTTRLQVYKWLPRMLRRLTMEGKRLKLVEKGIEGIERYRKVQKVEIPSILLFRSSVIP